MSENDTKLRDCFLINEFTARVLKKMFHVYGGRRDITNIEFGVPPKRWVKITYGRHSDEDVSCVAESPAPVGDVQSLSEKASEEK